MKKYICLIAGLLCLVVFVACGRGVAPIPPADAFTGTTEITTETETAIETTETEPEETEAVTEVTTAQRSPVATTTVAARSAATATVQRSVAVATTAAAKVNSTVPTTTRTTTTTNTTTTMRPTAAPTAAPTSPPAPVPIPLNDYEAMGQTLYQEKAIEALNAMRAERGLALMSKSDYLMSTCLDQARKMAAAESSFHTGEFPPGFESVSYVPYDFPAKVLGEMLTLHVGNFLAPESTLVGIAVVRNGNRLYACMQGN